MIKQTCKQIRAIPHEALPTLNEQELRDQGIFVEYWGKKKAVVLCAGYENSEWPGELIVGRTGMYGPERMAKAFEAIKSHPKSPNSPAKINSGFDYLTAPFANSEDEFECFVRRMTKIMGDG